MDGMETRQSLRKLNVQYLRQLAKEKGIDPKQNKEELITHLLGVLIESPGNDCIPANFPAFNSVSLSYNTPLTSDIPCLSFSSIYDFMITKQREDGECGRHNFKGLDKSVAHYDAGDIQDVFVAKVCL